MSDLRIHLKIPNDAGLGSKLLELARELQIKEDRAARLEQRLNREISIQEVIIKICSDKFQIQAVVPRRGRPYREVRV